ncbi:MAG: methyl-accepting chemotaxis protein [Clostridiales bacterium]|jgi:methyl-accepting chemotaxis protein|nr:methyl-accepting chemotaxis protein [Clostridiales bacterium]
MVNKEAKKSIKRRIVVYTTAVIIALVFVSSLIMMFSMKSLTNSILLDTLQPMIRESSKAVEGNLHLLADRLMSLANDKRFTNTSDKNSCIEAINEAKEVYEFYTIALYDKNGNLFLGDSDAKENITSQKIYTFLQETDNFCVGEIGMYNDKMGIEMGTPVKINNSTEFYLVGVYSYNALNEVLLNINIGKSGETVIVDEQGIVVGHRNTDMLKEKINIFDNCSETAKNAYTRMINGETGSLTASVNNEDVFIAFAPIRGTRWSLAVRVPVYDYTYLADKAIFYIILAAFIMFLISTYLIYRFSKSISDSINKATQRIVKLADGDLKSDVDIVNSKDEIQLLTSSLQKTVLGINYYISEIERVLSNISEGNFDIRVDGEYKGDFTIIRKSLSHIVDSLNDTMYIINNSAKNMSKTAHVLNEQSERLNLVSVNQNNSVENLVSEVEAVEKNLMAVSENSINTKNKVSEISEKIEKSNNRMRSLSEAMNEISEHAKEITSISKIIEDIAFQTEILSLNASIEAAKAGKYGRGFNVVAEEVKKLSNQSTTAAQNSGEMIQYIYKTILKGHNLMKETAAALEEVSELSKIIENITDNLEGTVSVQKNYLKSMAVNIENIAEIANENLTSSETTKQFSNEISDEANELYSVIEKFNLIGGKK